MPNELKPCECGNAAITWHEDFYPFDDPHMMYWVTCEKCGYESRIYKTEEEAIEAWNRRAVEE